MHYGGKEAFSFLENLFEKSDNTFIERLVICPPHTVLAPLKNHFGDKIKLAGQNCFYEEKGAFTGEISPSMLIEAGAEYVLIGHSERRGIFGEENSLCLRKVEAAMLAGLIPVFCVGESLDVREKGNHLSFVSEQLKGLPIKEGALMLAYEPIWAIGTGKTASLSEIAEMHEHIKKETKALYPLLYGGSVTPQNAGDILKQHAVDGVLVGGASLSVEKLEAILKARE